jgi:hypothetical protein
MQGWDFSLADGGVYFYNRVPIMATIFSARVEPLQDINYEDGERVVSCLARDRLSIITPYA